MVRNKATQSDQSFFFTAKGFSLAGLIFILTSGVLSACQSTSSSPVVTPPPQDYLLMKGVRQLTYDGENERPVFSRLGNKVLFVSRNRGAHKNTQLYEFDLRFNKERRITFQDGEIRDPIYLSEERIIYASSTDEIKENLADFFSTTATVLNRPPMEMYESDLFGNEIIRLTNSPGYDAEPSRGSERSPFLIFTSVRGGMLGLYRFDLRKKDKQILIADREKDRYSPTVSEDSKNIAWIEKSPKEKTTSIMMSSFKDFKPKVLKQSDNEIKDLSFITGKSQLLYSVQRPHHPTFIEVYDYEKNCTQVVFSGQDSLIQPNFSPGTPAHIVFTRVLKSSKQIYMVDWPADLGPCLESQQ